MRKGKKKQGLFRSVRINESITSSPLQVVGPEGENIGQVSIKVALEKAREYQLDLVEISKEPAVARITDYGKFIYDRSKKDKGKSIPQAANMTKALQIKVGTGADAVNQRVTQTAKWLGEGYKIKIDLFLFGRYKFMEESFLKERLQNFLDLITVPYVILEDMQKSSKGFSVTIQQSKKK